MIVRADIYRDSILYYHYICSKKLTGAYPQVSLPNPMGSPKFPEKVHWDTKNNFGNCGIYVYLHDPLDLPNDCLGLTKEKNHGYVPKNTTYIAHYCCYLLVLRLRQNIQGVPKKNRTGPYVHCEHNTLCMVNWLKKEQRKKNKKKAEAAWWSLLLLSCLRILVS